MKFPIKVFFSKCHQIRNFLTYLVTFTEEILNEKRHFLCSGIQILQKRIYNAVKHLRWNILRKWLTVNPFLHNVVKWPNIMHERINGSLHMNITFNDSRFIQFLLPQVLQILLKVYKILFIEQPILMK